MGVQSVPIYVNFSWRKTFRKGTLTYVGTCQYSAAATMQAKHFLLSLDNLHCNYFHLEHMKHFTCTLSLSKKQILSKKCSLHIQRFTAIWFTDRCCGCWKMFTNGLWLWCRRYFLRWIGQWNWSDVLTLLGLLWTGVGRRCFTGWSEMHLQEEVVSEITFDLGG